MQDSFRRVGAVALLGAVICLSSGKAQAIQCAIFARSVTGLDLSGDAWHWWNQASGTYARGNAPKSGAVLVFMRSAPMHHGHVSVVRKIVNSREILVDHANWGTRGAVSRNVAVMDDSPNNDWSSVRVAFGGGYGRSNPTYGFIYEAAASSADVIAAANHASDVAEQTASDDRDEVDENTPRHRNHRWVRLAIARNGVSHHGHGVWARQESGGHRAMTQVSYEATPRSHGISQTTHATTVHSLSKPSAKTASRADHGRTVATTTGTATKGSSAKATVVSSTGKHKTHARG